MSRWDVQREIEGSLIKFLQRRLILVLYIVLVLSFTILAAVLGV